MQKLQSSIFFFICMIATTASANEVTPPQTNQPPSELIEFTDAVEGVGEFLIIDKLSSKSVIRQIAPGHDMTFLDLTIKLTNCIISTKSGSAANLEIVVAGQEASQQFQGWIFSNFRAAHVYENSLYDVTLLHC